LKHCIERSRLQALFTVYFTKDAVSQVVCALLRSCRDLLSVTNFQCIYTTAVFWCRYIAHH